MKKRILFGLIMIAVVFGLLYLDWRLEQLRAGENNGRAAGTLTSVRGLPLAAVFLALTVVAFVEMARLASAGGVQILPVTGLLASALLATLPFWWQFIEPLRGPDGADVLLLLGLVVPAAFLEQMIRHRTDDALRRIGSTLLTILYLGVGGALVLHIRLARGVPTLIMFLAAVKFTDIGAYFTGSAVGRHKLIPWLSPGKSWEGLFGGLVAAAGLSILTAWVFGIEQIAVWEAAVFGAAVGVAGQFADLCESLLKRSAKLKDSGALVPEFGGVLDIIDSPLLAAPAACVLLAVLG